MHTHAHVLCSKAHSSSLRLVPSKVSSIVSTPLLQSCEVNTMRVHCNGRSTLR